MVHSITREQIRQSKQLLELSVRNLENFLNNTKLDDLLKEKEQDPVFYKDILSGLRRLLVNCEEGLETCLVVAKEEAFSKSATERTLYRIYHQCIEEFFSPKNDAWYEDSRSAYTGRKSITFRKETPASIISLLHQLEVPFQALREELEFYETDYATKMIQQ